MLSLLRTGNSTVRSRVALTAPQELAITVITVEEQLNGWYIQLRQPQSDAQLAAVYTRIVETTVALARLRVLTFDVPAIARYRGLVALKLNVGKMDLRIAAIALETGATVVTRNARDFGRVPGLAIADWSAP